ncbi:Domain of uncharacterised function (DUF427) [Bordetella ansorpii]|uniref:Domain of uncharacterized function (DUF427) n=1 Tax=Bordetella ansorpii TaxID=288768 RepID=A0A157SFX7_9BORD|nr:DUF427 domain-containing protein [Bordetella ansorpii]SAI69131.1 Domain of uncharacterised function (DUF427) [Bordetella ansorpii]
MSDKPVKIPGADHPIGITPNTARVVVTLGGRTLADTQHALTLREATYPPVHYIPREDVDMAQLQRTAHGSYCPYKGEAAYYSVPAGGARAENAAWSYEAPHPAVARIAGHLAFYPDRVDAIEEIA